jgi:hypothetical protein
MHVKHNWMFMKHAGQVHNIVKKGKSIPVTGRGGPLGCASSRLPHFLDSRLTDSGEVVSLLRRSSALYPQDDSWYSLLLEAESNQRPQYG